eukprot:10168725-Alexandrium_andersonii.AAC.1
MSASLVGSEMCIRDRPKPAKQTPLAACLGGGGWPRKRGSVRDRSWPLPVSYTHLTLPTICSV